MTDFRAYTRDFISDFIDMYRKEQCLWDTSCENYRNRILKAKAYEKLLKFLRTVEPKANVDSVKGKINSLRASFRKERKKVRSAKRSAPDHPYMPKLWYYPMLWFLVDQEQERSRQRRSSYSRSPSASSRHREDTPPPPALAPSRSRRPELMAAKSEDESHSRDHEDHLSDPSSPEPPRHTETHFIRERSRASVVAITPNEEHLISAIAEKLKKSKKEDDEYDIVGRNVAAKLRKLSNDQKIIAEKLIHDVLYAGQMQGLLHSTSLFTPH